jgi:prepilin-type N-terminal cleavage/methylation domain-containing protein
VSTSLRRHRSNSDAGFTLLEVMASMVLFGIMCAIVVTSYGKYRQSHELQGSADQLVSALRNIQEEATSEGVTYCMRLGADSKSWAVYKTDCTSGTNAGFIGKTIAPAVTYTAASFQDRNGATSTTDIYFYRSGMASRGTVKVIRAGSTRAYTITIVGLTGRVSHD